MLLLTQAGRRYQQWLIHLLCENAAPCLAYDRSMCFTTSSPCDALLSSLVVFPSMWKSRRHTALLGHLCEFYTSLDIDVFYMWGKLLFLLHTKGLKLGFVVDPRHVSHLQTFAYDLDSVRPLAVREVIGNQQHSSASQRQRCSALGEMYFGTRLIFFGLGNSAASDFVLPLALGWAQSAVSLFDRNPSSF